MIPKIIHFAWISQTQPVAQPPSAVSSLPVWASRNIDEFRRLNPGYEVRVHGPEVLLEELRPAYDLVSDPASKADLLRYSILRRFGGWWFDLDFWPLRPLDDAALAWGLDEPANNRVFISRQCGQSNQTLTYTNAVIACSADSPGLEAIIRSVVVAQPPSAVSRRTIYGPELVQTAVQADPSLFAISDACWFFPADIRTAWRYYGQCLSGQSSIVNRQSSIGNASLRLAHKDTRGQLPFAMHLWASAREVREGDKLTAALTIRPDSRPLALVQSGYDGHPLTAAAAGLAALGYRVERFEAGEGIGARIEFPDVIVLWNGMRDPKLTDLCRACARVVIFLEHGFFNRRQDTQIDTRGILHRASWATTETLLQPAPAIGVQRLREFYPSGIAPMRPGRTGYVLVLGQVSGDTQLLDSEIQGPLPIQQALAGAMQSVKGVECYFRPHPSCSGRKIGARHLKILPQLPEQADESGDYKANKGGSGLQAALAGARFVVTINSNAALEALAAGVPVLSFGPSLPLLAGCARKATVATIKADLKAMLAGWLTVDSAVNNLLAHLAARQWTNDELAEGTVLRELTRIPNTGRPDTVGANNNDSAPSRSSGPPVSGPTEVLP